MGSSKRTRAFIIGGSGLLLMILGIVIGKYILRMTTNKTKSVVCVDSSTHKQFKDWVSYILGKLTSLELYSFAEWISHNEADFLSKVA